MPDKLVAYICHPVAAPDVDGVFSNLKNAEAWAKWFVDHTPWAVSMPWLPLVRALPDGPDNPYRKRGLEDDVVMLERHDLAVLVGGRVSSGMGVERGGAIANGLNLIDLTSFGFAPPEPGSPAEAGILDLLLVLKVIGPEIKQGIWAERWEAMAKMVEELTSERDEWKRRAVAHGCAEEGDLDCG